MSTATKLVQSFEMKMPFPAPSHWYWLKNFSEELLKRGHYVTAVTSYRRPQPHPNYTEIIIHPPYNFSDFPASDFFSMKFNTVVNNLFLTWDVGLSSTEHAFKDKNVAEFINKTDLAFDVVILEQFFHDSWLPFAKKFDAPLLTIATLGHADYLDNAMGLITPSYVPHHVLTFTDNMSFYERCINLFWRLTDAFLRKYYYMAKMQEMADKYFRNAFNGSVPSILEIEKNISFRIINSHHSLSFARPRMPALTYIAGIHIKPVQVLPADVQDFLDSGSEFGVIYFSFGSCIRSVDLPEEKLLAFIETFRLLKQKVLWKFENDTLPNLPPNVFIRKWLPQNDVLAHPNVKLFLTHGGIFGTQESIYWSVPMLFIPIYSDQFRNAKRCVDAGFAEIISFQELSVQNLHEKLNMILDQNSYSNRINLVSQQFRDNLVDPMEESMYWIEFLARHKHHYPIFKPHSTHVPWYTYFYLDIIFFAIITLYITFALTKYGLKKIWQSFDTEKNIKQKFN
ncbi:UDP-glucuronosyltransferase 1-8-like isoform X2 [Contarinia nasturtii]|uniref:UDP-glucuronosyltransferase 1-8-like isoform X2 n=1 Tax=Contarinia nasturtii TaxID=265458 RepID=UPI0012D421E1|nr:UDP-glucuronosyltransferase 1-8-like isoform X2 [Contarinia nasturtii]